MATNFKVAFVVIAVANILAGECIETCGVDQECGDLVDEASLLALHKQRISAMVNQGMKDQTPSDLAAIQFYLAVVRHQDPVYSAWIQAQGSVSFATTCCSTPPPGAPDTAKDSQDKALACKLAFQQNTCDHTKLHTALVSLTDVPQKLGYTTTLEQVTDIALKFRTSNIATYSNVYAVQTETGVQQLQLYVSGTTQTLTVNGQIITGFTYTPSCDQDWCLGLENTLTWNEGNGNPSSGNLGFNYIMPYNKLPKNAYVGPYFNGQIGGKPVSGVVLQNNVVNCGTSTQGVIETNLSTFMMQGAPISCFSGPYCVHLDGKFHESLYNMTIQSSGVAVAGKMINAFRLFNNRIAWNLTGNDNAADLLFSRSREIGNKFAGTIKFANGSTYNISGYIPSTNGSCVVSPPLPAPVSNSVRVAQLVIKEFNSMVHLVLAMMVVNKGIELLPTLLKGAGTVLSKLASKISSTYKGFKARNPKASDDLPQTLSENEAEENEAGSADVPSLKYSSENLAEANPNPAEVASLEEAEIGFPKLESVQSEVDKTEIEIKDDDEASEEFDILATDSDLPESEILEDEQLAEAHKLDASGLESQESQDQSVSNQLGEAEASAAEEIKDLQDQDAIEIKDDQDAELEEVEEQEPRSLDAGDSNDDSFDNIDQDLSDLSDAGATEFLSLGSAEETAPAPTLA